MTTRLFFACCQRATIVAGMFAIAGFICVLAGCPDTGGPAVGVRQVSTGSATPSAQVPLNDHAPARMETTSPETTSPETTIPAKRSATQHAAGAGLPHDQIAQGPPYQPAKKPPREELFKDWPKPEVALFITGRQHGYIEPCGCTGLANQKGGLARRRTLHDQLLAKNWKLAPVDLGNLVRRTGRQAEIKFQRAAAGLKTMNYAAIGLGPDDLKISSDELFSTTANSEGQPSAFVSANVSVLAREFTKEYEIIQAGGKKIGVTAVLGAQYAKAVPAGDISASDPAAALAKVWPKLQAAKCDLYVLLAFAGLEESQALSQRFPGFQVVVTAGADGEPERVPAMVPKSGAMLVQTGVKGMYVGIVGLFNDQAKPLRYQRVPLDDRFGDSREILSLMARYQDDLKEAGFTSLGLKPLPHPTGRKFVGSQKCKDCHEDEFKIWQKSPHSHATDSLVHPGERSEIARHHDPECISCHVTGWQPQRFKPYETGYWSLKQTPLLTGSGCENCHGPGGNHVAAENGDIEVDDATIARYKREMRLTLTEAKKNKCISCHDLDNSPDFHKPGAFEKYWEKIKH